MNNYLLPPELLELPPLELELEPEDDDPEYELELCVLGALYDGVPDLTEGVDVEVELLFVLVGAVLELLTLEVPVPVRTVDELF